MALIIGLTGGVASGKTQVSDTFAGLGAAVIDTDLLAREVVAIGSPALLELRSQCGDQCFQPDGSLDRKVMRARVFGNAHTKRILEAITHPRIQALARTRALQAVLAAPYVVVVIPLLSAGTRYTFLNRVLVVDVAPEVQLARLMARDGIGLELAQAMLKQQLTRSERLALADDVIDNSASQEILQARVVAQHQHYLSLAKAPEPQ
jgi:dephospho-CoA kinase